MVSKRYFNNPSKSVKNIKLNSISCLYCIEMCPQEAIKPKLRGFSGYITSHYKDLCNFLEINNLKVSYFESNLLERIRLERVHILQYLNRQL